MPTAVRPLALEDSRPASADASQRAPERQYSIAKFLALQRYTETASRWRVAWALLSTPLYGLACALLPSFVPLQDPLDPRGVFANPGYLVNTYILCFVVLLGTFMHWRASTGLPSSVYSWHHVLIGATVAASVQSLFALFLAVVWQFPIPMSWIVVSAISGVSIGSGHLAAFRQRCWQDQQLMTAIKRYLPALNLQTLQLVLYPAFSVLFDRVSTGYQVLLTVLFPLLKYVLKTFLHKLTRELNDFSTEVAVSGIEICAALYQSMIMQNAPSQVAMAIIMGVDVVQGLVVVKFFMDRRLATSRQHLIVVEAVKELKLQQSEAAKAPVSAVVSNDDAETIRAGSFATWAEARLFSSASRLHPHTSRKSVAPAMTGTTPNTEAASPCVPTSLVVRQALELVDVAESILLVEYLEVAIPLVNGIFVAISCQFSASQYNTRLRRLYFHPEALSRALISIGLYALLQAVSFVAMHLVMKYRYGLSAAYHLAFLLERHHASIVGKTLAWLPIILHFTGVHYGVDFSFRFDFDAMLRRSTGS